MSCQNKITLDKFNRELDFSLKNGIAEDVNYGTLLSWDLEHHLSAIAKYAPPKAFAVLNKDLTVGQCTADENTEFYYGASPLLDSRLIIDAISELKFTDTDSLNSFLSEHSSFFMLHTDNGEYLPYFAKYTLLAVAGNYGLVFKKDERLLKIKAALKLPKTVWGENEKAYFIKGCPTNALLKELCRYKYINRGDMLEIPDSEDGKSIDEIYSQPQNIQLLNGDVFYSGVLLKPNELSVLQNTIKKPNGGVL
ncbi:MAG: hypothetical protein U0M60_20505 [Clostridia bacterium]|nr:hypothetical protein [Clostridia bacterium]